MAAGRAGGVGSLNVGGGFANPAGGGPGGGFDFLRGLGDFFGSDNFKNIGSLALQGIGFKQQGDFLDSQIGLQTQQENRASTAQNLNTGHNLSLALQTTTPGTAEHERIKEAIASGQFQV